jgi:hypothetical protein
MAKQLSSGSPFTIEEFNNLVNELNNIQTQVNSIERTQQSTRLTHSINGVDVDLGKLKIVAGAEVIAWTAKSSQQFTINIPSAFQAAGNKSVPVVTVTANVVGKTYTFELSLSSVTNAQITGTLAVGSPESKVPEGTPITLNFIAVGTR